VIAPEGFKETAQRLADYRQSKGLKSLVVTPGGHLMTHSTTACESVAITRFSGRSIQEQGARKKVRYAVLAGKGNLRLQ